MITAVVVHRPSRSRARPSLVRSVAAAGAAFCLALPAACSSDSDAATTSLSATAPPTTRQPTTTSSASASSASASPTTTTDDSPSPPAATDAGPVKTEKSTPTPADTVPQPTTAPTTTIDEGVDVTFDLVAGTPPEAGNQQCTPDTLACVLPLSSIVTTLTGDLAADVVSASAVSTRADRLAAVALIVLSGTVADCGVGTLAMSIATTLQLNGPAASAPISHWQILPGSGTGDLVEVTGGGDGGEGTGTMTGRIVCH